MTRNRGDTSNCTLSQPLPASVPIPIPTHSQPMAPLSSSWLTLVNGFEKQGLAPVFLLISRS